MHWATSSAPVPVLRPGLPLAGADPAPFHCIGDEAHRWGLERSPIELVILGLTVDRIEWRNERCKICGAARERD